MQLFIFYLLKEYVIITKYRLWGGIKMPDKLVGKKVTIKDIAREAGISPGAVSQILNNKPCRISEENKQRVREIAAKHRYVVNQTARALVTQRSYTIGLILPDIQNTFFSKLARVLEEVCREKGYYLMFANSDDLFENDCKLLSRFESRGVDGIFFIRSNESYLYEEQLSRRLQKMAVPYVIVDRPFFGFACDHVCFDNRLGGYQATKYLLENGHRDIACIYLDDKRGNGANRLAGYRDALREQGIEPEADHMIKGDNRIQGGYNAVEQVLKCGATAVLVCNDMMTLGFLRGLQERKYKVPRDISVVSYDNSLREFLLDITLTTVTMDLDLLAQRAAEVMLGRIEGKRIRAQEIYLEPVLAVGNSVLSKD